LNLSRLVLASSDDSASASAPEKPTIKGALPNAAAPIFLAPKALEGVLKELDDTVSKDEVISWSADYFKYRILGTQRFPFSFDEVMQKAEAVFDEPPYEEIKEIVFNLLGKGGGLALLSQSFDLNIDANIKEASGRKAIVFGPAA
jgi:hypothetical protein